MSLFEILTIFSFDWMEYVFYTNTYSSIRHSCKEYQKVESRRDNFGWVEYWGEWELLKIPNKGNRVIKEAITTCPYCGQKLDPFMFSKGNSNIYANAITFDVWNRG